MPATSKKTKDVVEFGDFQTPVELARSVCRMLESLAVNPSAIIEPTCGIGNFLLAALDGFREASIAVGMEINPVYAGTAKDRLKSSGHEQRAAIVCQDFFATNWPKVLSGLPDPLLVIGNPPWVTNAGLGTVGSRNLPLKSNFQKLDGLEAMTGKSNFDISEWMIINLIKWLEGRRATLAMLCKTSVARRILAHAWGIGNTNGTAKMFLIDAGQDFGVSVDACLLTYQSFSDEAKFDCPIHSSLAEARPSRVIGYRDNQLVADVELYERWAKLQGSERYKWRSGIKHDCSRVMELKAEGDLYRNGLGELVDLEEDYLYPMLKSSDLSNGKVNEPPVRRMVVTQSSIGQDTDPIRTAAPRTWEYLQQHASLLDARSSSIYRNRPSFSVFGVGPYSFAPWKVAISGFYKRLSFSVVGSYHGKPIVLDDTCYSIACETEDEAELIASLLNSAPATGLLNALVFWDAKRPITIDLLRRLDLLAVARQLDVEDELLAYMATIRSRPWTEGTGDHSQRMLFENT